MASHAPVHDPLVRRSPDRSPLEVAEDTFVWLVTGPAPLAVHGGHLPGLPNRRLALHQLRSRLIGRRLGSTEVDAVWAHLVVRARTAPTPSRRAGWTVGCVGVAMPTLARTAANLSLRYSGDPADVEAAVLSGFVNEIHRTDICTPHIARRLRAAAERSGRALVDTLTTTTLTTNRPATDPTPAPGAPGATAGTRATTDRPRDDHRAATLGPTTTAPPPPPARDRSENGRAAGGQAQR